MLISYLVGAGHSIGLALSLMAPPSLPPSPGAPPALPDSKAGSASEEKPKPETSPKQEKQDAPPVPEVQEASGGKENSASSDNSEEKSNVNAEEKSPEAGMNAEDSQAAVPTEGWELEVPPEAEATQTEPALESGANSDEFSDELKNIRSDSAPPRERAPGDPLDRPARLHRDIKGPSAYQPPDRIVMRTAVEREPSDRITFLGMKQPPKRTAFFTLGYRYFSGIDGLNRQQDWHIAAIGMSPLRRYFRLNIITEAGIEGGEAAKDDRGDFFVMEKVGVGVQYPFWVTPFLEFQGGVGAGRIELFERNDLALIYSMGVEGGAQWALTRRLFLSASVGWLRPTFRIGSEAATSDRMTFTFAIGM